MREYSERERSCRGGSRAALSVLLPVLILLVFACSSTGDGPNLNATPAIPVNGALSIRAFDFGFEPKAIELTKGQEVDITLRNEGEIAHNLRIDGLDADVIESSKGGELFVEAANGETATLAFTPTEEGSFTYFCSIPDHRDLGMEGVLVVEAAPAPATPN